MKQAMAFSNKIIIAILIMIHHNNKIIIHTRDTVVSLLSFTNRTDHRSSHHVANFTNDVSGEPAQLNGY